MMRMPAVDQRCQEGGPLHLLLVSWAAGGRAEDRAVDLLPASHAADELVVKESE